LQLRIAKLEKRSKLQVSSGGPAVKSKELSKSACFRYYFLHQIATRQTFSPEFSDLVPFV